MQQIQSEPDVTVTRRTHLLASGHTFVQWNDITSITNWKMYIYIIIIIIIIIMLFNIWYVRHSNALHTMYLHLNVWYGLDNGY